MKGKGLVILLMVGVSPASVFPEAMVPPVPIKSIFFMASV